MIKEFIKLNLISLKNNIFCEVGDRIHHTFYQKKYLPKGYVLKCRGNKN